MINKELSFLKIYFYINIYSFFLKEQDSNAENIYIQALLDKERFSLERFFIFYIFQTTAFVLQGIDFNSVLTHEFKTIDPFTNILSSNALISLETNKLTETHGPFMKYKT